MFNLKRPKSKPDPDGPGLSWEADIMLGLRSSLKRQQVINVGLLAAVLVLACAIIVMIPLRKVVPYVVTVDKLTGQASVVSTANDVAASGELNDKHWIQQFLISRERYSYTLLQYDYDQVKRLAGDQPWAVYDKQFQGDAPLDKKYGANIEVLPVVLSITLSEGGLATVRYELRTKDFRLAADPVVTRRIATFRYRYEPKSSVLQAEAIKNPFGFTVTGYQTDPELVNTEASK